MTSKPSTKKGRADIYPAISVENSSASSNSIHPQEQLSYILPSVWSREVSAVLSQDAGASKVVSRALAHQDQSRVSIPQSTSLDKKPTKIRLPTLKSSASSASPLDIKPSKLPLKISNLPASTTASRERLSIIKEDSPVERDRSSKVPADERVPSASSSQDIPRLHTPVVPKISIVSDLQLSKSPLIAPPTGRAFLGAKPSTFSTTSSASAYTDFSNLSNLLDLQGPVSSATLSSVSSVTATERLLRLASQEKTSKTSSLKPPSEGSATSMAEKKSFLHGLFGKWSSNKKIPSDVSLEMTPSMYSMFSIEAKGPLTAKSAASARTGATLAGFRAYKANHIDAIFARAALSSLNVAEAGDAPEGDSHKRRLDSMVPFPVDLPPLYTVIVNQLETDTVYDKLIPFTLRRLHELGYERRFLDHIMSRIQARDEEIQHICAANAFVLTESARDFVDLNDRLDQLRDDVVTLDDREIYAKQLKDIKYAKKDTRTTSSILSNVALLMERISALRPALKGLGEAVPFAREAEPVKALRKLCEAEESTVHLPPQIGFVSWLATSIPEMKYKLIAASIQGVTQTLDSMRNHNLQAGYSVLRNICHMYRLHVEPFVFNKPELTHDAHGTKEAKPLFKEGHLPIQKCLNLRPLYNFRHILITLMESPGGIDVDYLFHCYVTYMAERHNQILKKLEFEEIKSIKDVRTYIQKITGIFGFEMYISHYVPGITSELYYVDLWKETSVTVAETLQKNITLATDETTYEEFKNLLKLFTLALGMLRCDPTCIIKVTEKLGSHYCAILQSDLNAAMMLSLSKDLYQFAVLMGESEQKQFLEIFDPWVGKPGMDAKHFPKKLPFSQSVPEIYGSLKKFITANASLDEDLGIELEESAQRIMELTRTALTSGLHGAASEIFNQGYLLVAQYVQMYRNWHYIKEAIPNLEKFIAEVLKIDADDYDDFSLTCGQVFDSLAVETEHQLLMELTGYMTAVLHDSQIDLYEPPEGPSQEAEKLMAFIENFFKQTDSLMRPEFAQKAFAMIWTQIPSTLETVWIYESTTVSLNGIMQLRLDIEQYDIFLQKFRLHIQHPSSFNEGFISLLQLTDLVLSEDWDEYTSKFGQKNFRYSLAPPSSALRLLHKLNDLKAAVSSSNMYVSVKAEKEKLRQRELLIIQLDDLATVGKVVHFKKNGLNLDPTKSQLSTASEKSHADSPSFLAIPVPLKKTSETIKPSKISSIFRKQEVESGKPGGSAISVIQSVQSTMSKIPAATSTTTAQSPKPPTIPSFVKSNIDRLKPQPSEISTKPSIEVAISNASSVSAKQRVKTVKPTISASSAK